MEHDFTLRHLLILMALAAIWGSSFLFVRLTVHEMGAVPVSAVRTLIGAATLAPLLLWRGQWRVFKGNWPHLLALGLFSTALPFPLINLATQYSSAGFSAILNTLMPIMSALIAWLWLKEYLSIPAICGIGLSFIGAAVMVTDVETISANFLPLPILTGLAATTFYALTGNYSRRFLPDVSPLTQAAGCHVFGALLLSPFAWLLWPADPLSPSVWVNVLALGLLCTGFPFILYFYLLNQVGVARAVIVTYLIPVFAALLGFLFLREAITLAMLAGAFFILTGVALTTGLINRGRKGAKRHASDAARDS